MADLSRRLIYQFFDVDYLRSNLNRLILLKINRFLQQWARLTIIFLFVLINRITLFCEKKNLLQNVTKNKKKSRIDHSGLYVYMCAKYREFALPSHNVHSKHKFPPLKRRHLFLQKCEDQPNNFLSPFSLQWTINFRLPVSIYKIHQVLRPWKPVTKRRIPATSATILTSWKLPTVPVVSRSPMNLDCKSPSVCISIKNKPLVISLLHYNMIL